MKLATDWAPAARTLFASHQRILLVGAKGFGHASQVQVKDMSDVEDGSESFDGVVWQAHPSLRPGLSQARRFLRPEGLLLLVAAPAGMTRKLWSALSLAAVAAPVLLEDACEALLLAGFAQPRLVARGGASFALAARKPRVLSALDAFFEQPAP